MGINIPLFGEIYLKIGAVVTRTGNYPTSQLQKGLILISNGQALVEEGVGFGVPVLKLGAKTIFPGEIELAGFETGSHQKIAAIFSMNLEEKLARHDLGKIQNKLLYRIKNRLENLYIRFPTSRGPLMVLSNALRRSFGWETIFVDAGWDHEVKVNYDIDSGKGVIKVDVDTAGLKESGATEIFLMNEQGAHYFDTYSDSNGLFLKGDKIGNWDEVTAENATFLCNAHHLAFSFQQTDGARLYRGRELVGSRLAWSGFGYFLPSTCQRFTYVLRIDRLA